MIDTCGDNINLVTAQLILRFKQTFTLSPMLDTIGNLPMSTLYTMTEANRLYTTVFVARPDVHCHWIRIIEKKHTRFRNFAYIATKIQQRRNCALSIHNA